MSDTTLLRTNAIRNNASTGATTPGPVKTGELPHVQVRPVPSAPPLQASQQQKTVSILAPNSKGSVTSGQLPMIQIKMTQTGPQHDTGQESPVVIKENKQQTITAGQLPMVEVKMDGGRPQVKTMPTVHGAPPRIPTAAPALSAPRVAHPGQGTSRVTRVAAPVPALVSAVPLPELPAFTTDELMLFQHALTKYVGDLSVAAETSEGSEGSEVPPESEAVQFAKATIAKIDDALVAIVVHAEAAANAPAPVTVAPAGHYVNPRAGTGGYFSPAAIAPQAQAQMQAPQQALTPAPAVAAPRTGGYVMQQPSIRRTQLNSGLVPRGVKRAQPAGDGKLPMVQVKMEGQRPTVVNQAEIEAAKAAREAQAQAQAQPQAADMPADLSQG